MDSAEFRRHGHALVEWIADYLDGSERYPVLPRVAPGDVVAADDDGIVVIPRAAASQVADAAATREQKEDANRKRLAAGELGLDIYGMRDALAKAGLRYVDHTDQI